jgi:ribosome-associated protein
MAAAQGAEDNRGQEIVVLDMQGQTPIFDYFVLATGASQRQLRAMADAIDDVLQKEWQQHRLSVGGYEQSKWIVLDYGPVVIHLFDADGREYYRLEDLWAAAPRVPRGT